MLHGLLDLRKTSHLPDQSSTNSETVLSGGDEPVGSLTTEKQFVDGDGRSGGAGILRKSSLFDLRKMYSTRQSSLTH
jgi:hypothetical protein